MMSLCSQPLVCDCQSMIFEGESHLLHPKILTRFVARLLMYMKTLEALCGKKHLRVNKVSGVKTDKNPNWIIIQTSKQCPVTRTVTVNLW